MQGLEALGIEQSGMGFVGLSFGFRVQGRHESAGSSVQDLFAHFPETLEEEAFELAAVGDLAEEAIAGLLVLAAFVLQLGAKLFHLFFGLLGTVGQVALDLGGDLVGRVLVLEEQGHKVFDVSVVVGGRDPGLLPTVGFGSRGLFGGVEMRIALQSVCKSTVGWAEDSESISRWTKELTFETASFSFSAFSFFFCSWISRNCLSNSWVSAIFFSLSEGGEQRREPISTSFCLWILERRKVSCLKKRSASSKRYL